MILVHNTKKYSLTHSLTHSLSSPYCVFLTTSSNFFPISVFWLLLFFPAHPVLWNSCSATLAAMVAGSEWLGR